MNTEQDTDKKAPTRNWKAYVDYQMYLIETFGNDSKNIKNKEPVNEIQEVLPRKS